MINHPEPYNPSIAMDKSTFESTAVKIKCCDCQKEAGSYISLLHSDGILYFYCYDCAAKKLNTIC